MDALKLVFEVGKRNVAVGTVETQFNEVARDRLNVFIKSRFGYI